MTILQVLVWFELKQFRYLTRMSNLLTKIQLFIVYSCYFKLSKLFHNRLTSEKG